MGLNINLKQAQELVEFFGGDENCEMYVEFGDGHSGKGLYACCSDYPEEGSVFLGKYF